MRGEILDYNEVREKLDVVLDWVAQLYINTLNVIHYMHDKYCYEALEMALHDKDILRTMGLRHRGAERCGGLPERHQVRDRAPDS